MSGTRCFLDLLILKYIRASCLDKKVDINIPNNCSSVLSLMCSCVTYFFIICVPLLLRMCIAERIAAWVHICFRTWTLWLNIDLRSWRVLRAWHHLGLWDSGEQFSDPTTTPTICPIAVKKNMTCYICQNSMACDQSSVSHLFQYR